MSKNTHAARAALLTGKMRDITRTRDGFLVAAVILGNDSAKAVATIAGVDDGNVSRLVKMARTYPEILALVDAIEGSAKGDAAALALGTALAERKQANAAAAAANKSTARNAGGTPASNNPAPVAPADIAPKGESVTTNTRAGAVTTTLPMTPADILTAAAAMRDAVAGMTFTAAEAGLLEEALAEVWSSVTVG